METHYKASGCNIGDEITNGIHNYTSLNCSSPDDVMRSYADLSYYSFWTSGEYLITEFFPDYVVTKCIFGTALPTVLPSQAPTRFLTNNNGYVSIIDCLLGHVQVLALGTCLTSSDGTALKYSNLEFMDGYFNVTKSTYISKGSNPCGKLKTMSFIIMQERQCMVGNVTAGSFSPNILDLLNFPSNGTLATLVYCPY